MISQLVCCLLELAHELIYVFLPLGVIELGAIERSAHTHPKTVGAHFDSMYQLLKRPIVSEVLRLTIRLGYPSYSRKNYCERQ
jgi:hypothetical protein